MKGRRSIRTRLLDYRTGSNDAETAAAAPAQFWKGARYGLQWWWWWRSTFWMIMLAWRCPNPRRAGHITRKDHKGRADTGLAQHEHNPSGDAQQEWSDRRRRSRRRAASNHDSSILYCIVWILYIDLPTTKWLRCCCPGCFVLFRRLLACLTDDGGDHKIRYSFYCSYRYCSTYQYNATYGTTISFVVTTNRRASRLLTVSTRGSRLSDSAKLAADSSCLGKILRNK